MVRRHPQNSSESMSAVSERTSEVRPHLVRRRTGGWLAISPSGARFSLGVTAPTEQEAREKFGFTFYRWLEIIRDTKNDVAT